MQLHVYAFLVVTHWCGVLGEEKEESLVTCVDFLDGSSFGCVKYEEANFDEKHWTTVMGIGPAKSGTTSLSHELSLTDVVVVGDRDVDMEEEHEILSELQWLVKDSYVRQGLKDLSQYFPEASEEAVGYFEKNPQYGTKHAAYAAYRARAFFGPNMKLLHTSRDFVDLDGSLYIYRRGYNRASYADWVDFRIEGFVMREACRAEEFAKLMIPTFDNSKISIRDLHNPRIFSREAASRVETHLFIQCDKNGVKGDKRQATGIQDYLHAIFMVEDLKRWMHAFGSKSKVHCIDLANRIKDPVKTFLDMYKFLGVKDDKFFEERREALVEKQSEDRQRHARYGLNESENMINRLVEVQEGILDENINATQSVIDARNRIAELAGKYIYCEDLEWYEEVCGYRPPGYTSCLTL